MANLQYVGPRVVPKPYRNPDTGDASWKSGVAYEALMMVTYNGNGYVSAVPVPPSVGNPADNPDYWVESADFDAALSDLQTRMSTAESDINTLEHVKVGQLSNRKFLFLGDSYYLGGTGATYTGIGWASQMINFLGLSSSQYILTPASDIINPGGTVSTPGFYPSAGNHRSFKTILEAVTSHLTPTEIASITDIVVAGGYNDRNQGNAIITGISEYAAYAKQHYPNAHLWAAHVGYSTTAARRVELLITRLLYRECAKYGISYINSAEFVLYSDSLFLSDGIHPTEDGYKYIGTEIANALIGGGAAFRPNPTFEACTFDDSIVSSTSGYIGVICYEHGKKNVYISGARLNTNSIDLTSGQNFDIPIENDMLQPTDVGYQAQMMLGIVGTDFSDYVIAEVRLIQGSSKILRIRPYESVSGVTIINFPPVNQVLTQEHI